MSLDLQTLIRGLSGIVPEGIELDVQMRIVDTYIKVNRLTVTTLSVRCRRFSLVRKLVRKFYIVDENEMFFIFVCDNKSMRKY
jgi:hypothetical protein